MGWLALAGSAPSLNQSGAQISERLLELADLSQVPLLLTPVETLSTELQEFVEDLGILLSHEVQVIHPDDLAEQELRELWLNAGIVIMAGGSQAYWREVISERLFKIQPQEILAEGAVLFCFGACASLMGAWAFNQELLEIEKGLGWVFGSLVVPTNTDPAEIAAVHNHLEERANVFALGLPDGAVLALGPEGQVEVWTQKAPVLLFGRGWQQE
jgi:hypothetical protein